MDKSNAVIKGAVGGAAMGSVLGPYGTAGGFVIGAASSYMQAAEQERAMAEARASIEARPDFEASAAYINAASQAAKTSRWAQEGLSAAERNYSEQNIKQGMGSALSQAKRLDSGLTGMTSIMEAYNQANQALETRDEQAKRANRGASVLAAKNYQSAQETAFSLELGKAQDLANIDLGIYQEGVNDSQNMMNSLVGGAQNLMDYGTSNWERSKGDNKIGTTYANTYTNEETQKIDPHQAPKVIYDDPAAGQGAVFGGGFDNPIWNPTTNPLFTNQSNG